MSNYLFGAVYVIEPDYSDEEMQRDLKRMKDCGYNLVTLWPLNNPWLTNDSHAFVFTKTKKVLDICEELGMKAIMQLFGQNQSQEFMPDSALTPEMEDNDERGYRADINGSWANLNHPIVRDYFEKYFKETITALKDHPAIYGWDVYNEAHYRSDDPYTTRRYQNWLKDKYQDINILNHKWHRRYESFAQVRPDKRRSGYSIWSSLLPDTDYEKFRSENLTELCKFLCQIAYKYDTEHPIIIDGSSAWIIEDDFENTQRNCDEFEVAKLPTDYGSTFYPKSWGRNYKDTPWALSLYFEIPASAAYHAGKPYFVNELQTHTQSALTPGSEVSPEELKSWIMMCIFTGPKGMQLWRWRPFLHGYQVTGRGLTQMDDTPNKRSTAVEEVLKVVNDNPEVFSEFKIKKPTVQISYANCKNKLATPWHDTVRRTVTFDELS